MFGKLYKNSSINSILVISLSNIGDVVLTCPVIDILLNDFPKARFSIIVGDKAKSLFEGHPRIEVIVYHKQMPLPYYVRWYFRLRAKSFDVIVDLRESALGVFLPSRFCTPMGKQNSKGHMYSKHMERLKAVYPNAVPHQKRLAILPKLVPAMSGLSKYVVLAPGAANHNKRWHASGFVGLADRFFAKGQQIVFVGDHNDVGLVDGILAKMKKPALSIAGKIDLRELAFIVKQAQCVVTNDSGPMHLASYFDVPVVALWGPTDAKKYGPWSKRSEVVFKGKDMSVITVEDVLNAVTKVS